MHYILRCHWCVENKVNKIAYHGQIVQNKLPEEICKDKVASSKFTNAVAASTQNDHYHRLQTMSTCVNIWTSLIACSVFVVTL